MIYVEYISRRPGVALAEFHEKATAGQSGWASGYDDDVLLLNLGRTWRLGREPEYMTIWYSPRAGLERFDEWQAIFESGSAASVEESFASVARIDIAGCYEAVLNPVTGAQGPYYAEFVELPGTLGDDELIRHARAAEGPGVEHVLAVRRIGVLGPEPNCFVVWKLGRFADLEHVARRGSDGGSARVVSAGVYADFGKEIL